MKQSHEYFDSVAQRTAFIREDWRNAVSFAIDYHPRGVYEAIRAVWPADLPVWGAGVAEKEPSKQQMERVLLERLNAYANSETATLQFLAIVPDPTNPDAANTWLKKAR